MRQLQISNSKLFQSLTTFKEDIDKPLSAILTLNTIAHTVGAIGVGAQAGALFGNNAYTIAGVNVNMESVIATVMTLAILILSEIIPKTIGANNWKSLTPFTVVTLEILLKILSPFVWLSQLITKGLKKNKNESVLSRADILAMTTEASKEGKLHLSESKVIQNVLNLPNLTVHDIMTPRKVMFAAYEEDTIAELSKEESFEQFSRIPLFDKSKENIVGMVLKNEVLDGLINNKGSAKLSSIKRPISFVNEDEVLASFFTKKSETRAHMHIVIDKYKSITGLVTMEDVLETILGYEIVDETDKVEDMQQLTKG